MTQERIISAMTEDIGTRCDYTSSLEEQIGPASVFGSPSARKERAPQAYHRDSMCGRVAKQEKIMKREEHETNDYEA